MLTAASSTDGHYHHNPNDLAQRHSLYQHGFNPATSLQGPIYDLNPPPPSGYSHTFSLLSNKDTQGWTGNAALLDFHQYPTMNHNSLYTQPGEHTQSAPVSSDYYSDQQHYYFHNGVPKSGPAFYTFMAYQEEPSPQTTTTTECDHYTNNTPSTLSTSPSTIVEELCSPQPASPPEVKTESVQISCTFSHYVPPKPKTVARKKKPAMACLFCRARKIACAPAVPGSAETRCNQCARREIDCQYPKESRRGHYRRLQYLERIGKAVEEKIAQVEQQSARATVCEWQHNERRDRRMAITSQPY